MTELKEREDKMEERIIDKLYHALTYGGDDRPALVARIPVICNDIRWIKKALIGLYAVLIGGALLGVVVALVSKYLGV